MNQRKMGKKCKNQAKEITLRNTRQIIVIKPSAIHLLFIERKQGNEHTKELEICVRAKTAFTQVSRISKNTNDNDLKIAKQNAQKNQQKMNICTLIQGKMLAREVKKKERELNMKLKRPEIIKMSALKWTNYLTFQHTVLQIVQGQRHTHTKE